MKKFLTVLLAAALLLTLAGCGGKEAISAKTLAGEWTCPIDVTEKMSEMISSGDEEYARYFHFQNLTLAMNIQISESGDYQLYVDPDSIGAMYENLRQSMTDGFLDYCDDMVEQLAAGYGMSVDALFEKLGVENSLGILEQFGGISLDEMIDSVFSRESLTEQFASVRNEGTISVDGNQITFTVNEELSEQGTYDEKEKTITIRMEVPELELTEAVFTRK